MRKIEIWSKTWKMSLHAQKCVSYTWQCWALFPAVSGGISLTATDAESPVPPACPSPPPTPHRCAATRPNKRRWQGRHHSSHPIMPYHCLLVPGMEICGTPQVFGTCCPPWLPAASWAALLPYSAAESSRWKVICLTWCERDFTSIRTLDDRGEGDWSELLPSSWCKMSADTLL